MLAQLLRHRNINYEKAEDGKIALEIVNSQSMDINRFQCIFMDNTMPNMVSSVIYMTNITFISPIINI